MSTGKFLWRRHMSTPMGAGATVTASDLVFTIDQHGVIYAFNARTGKTVWKANLGLAGAAAPVIYTIKGKQYCTPISVDDWVMYYDKKTFAKYGLSAPKTWTEMMADAAVLKKNGISPFWSSGGDPWAFVWFQILLAGTDLQLYKDLSTGKASYTDPKVVAVMKVWLDMEKKGQLRCLTSNDCMEGVAAWMQKREPSFSGK